MKKIITTKLYPLLFDYFLISKFWGGYKAADYFNIKTPYKIGEILMLCDNEVHQSTITNGFLKGKTLNDLIKQFGSDVIKEGYQGEKFPLIIKIIDASSVLSLQVHPTNEDCKNLKGNSRAKSEAWYIIGSEQKSFIMAGSKANVSLRQLANDLNYENHEDYLEKINVDNGDFFFIPAGLTHAIGAGNLILEVSQNSLSTFRINDWQRKMSSGTTRELHLSEAETVFNGHQQCTKALAKDRNFEEQTLLCDHEYFKIDELSFKLTADIALKSTKSCHVIAPVNGAIKVVTPTSTVEVKRGMSCLVPANFGEYYLSSKDSNTTALKITL